MKNDLPPPNQPLQNPKHEAFCRAVAGGQKQSRAYAEIYGVANNSTCRVSASQLAASPPVKARIAWLRVAHKDQSAPAHAQKENKVKIVRVSHEPPKGDAAPIITRSELAERLSIAIREGNTSEITQASQALVKIMPELARGEDDDKPNPLMVANYLASWAGYPGHDLAKELGGLELLTRKWIHVLQVDIRELQAVINKIARSGSAPEADPQTA